MQDSELHGRGTQSAGIGNGLWRPLTSDRDGAFEIQSVSAGEWLEYTIDVREAGTYAFDVRYATDYESAGIHSEVDGKPITPTIIVPLSGGWTTWKTHTISGITLAKGKRVLRLQFDFSELNVNWMDVRRAD